MLQLYDLNHNKLHGLKSYKDLKVERELSGDEVLFFSYPNLDSKYESIKEECYIRTRKNEYVIKEINIQDDWTAFVAKINIEDIKGKVISNFETVEQTCANTVNLALIGTGWTIGSCDVTKKRTVRKANCSSYDILQEIRKVYLCNLKFDAINKKVYIYQSMGTDKGVYFSDSLNLRKLDIQSNSYDFVTRIIPIGKDGLKITAINGGKEYVENYQYSTKVITAYWEDNRYTVVESLKEDAIAKLNELSKPFKSYSSDIIDLASLNVKYKNILDYDLGDTITLISKDKKVKEKQRIVKLIEYPDEPERNSCEIANKTLSFEDIQADNQDVIDAADSVITSDGMIDNSKVNFDPIRLEVTTLVAEKANIGELNAVVARIGDLEATKANITDLTAINASISTLEAGSATIIQLNATNARITILESDTATINNLLSQTISTTNLNTENINAINANILDLQAGKANIVDLTASQAEIANLKSGKANITDLTAANANITNLTSQVATIDTLINGNITSANMATGAIKAGDAVIANGAISSAQIISLDVAKINAGDISTTKFRIISDSGKMIISDNTIQIKDSNRVRVQIGKDASNDYNMYVWDSSGNLMFDATGLKASGIKSKIIRDDMVSDTANISGSKIEKESLITQINGATTTLKANRIKLDTENQILDVAFTSLKSTVTTTANTVSSQGTAISTIQGQISSKIWQTDITTAVDNINIGGRNLWLKSQTTGYSAIENLENNHITGQKECYKLNSGATLTFNIEPDYSARLCRKVSFSAWVKYENVVAGANSWNKFNIFKHSLVRKNTSSGSTTSTDYLTLEGFTGTSGWKKVTYTYDYYSSNYDQLKTSLRFNLEGTVSGTAWITGIKVELGDKATDWSPAPEDTQSQITTINDNYSTLTQTVSGITTSVASLSSSIDTTNGNVTAVDNKVSTLTQTVNGLSSTVTSVQQNYLTKNDASTTYSTNTRVSTLEQTVNGLSSTVSSVQINYLTKADATTTYATNINVSALSQTVSGLSSTVSSVQTTANSKKRVFTSQPTTPYDVGDLWVSTNGTGDLMTCKTARASGTYTASDWIKGVKYTDDTTANNVQTNLNTTNSNLSSLTIRVSTAESSITQLNNSINLKVSASDFSSYQNTVTNNLNSKANQSSLDTTNSNISNLTTRVSTAESSISILQNQISLKVEQNHITTAINNLQVGGRNLLPNTSSDFKTVTFGGWDYYFPSNLTSWEKSGKLVGRIYLKPTNQEASCMLHVRYTGGTYNQYRGNIIGAGSEGYSIVSITVPNRDDISHIQFSIRHSASSTPSDTVLYKEVKVEKGDKVTDWSPAPEDVTNYTDIQISTAKAEIKITTDGISSTVSSVQSSVNSLGTRMSTAESSITSLNNSINLKVSTTDFNSYKTANDSAVNSKASQTALNTTNSNLTALTTRVSTAESSISILQGQIVSKVSQTDIDNSINGIQIGGKNLVRNSTFNQQGNYWTSIPTSNMYMILNAESDKPNSNILEFNYAAGSAAAYLHNTQRCLVKADNTEKYIVGFDIYVQAEGDVLDSVLIFSNRLITTSTGSDWSNNSDINFSQIKSQIVYGKWSRVYIARTIPNNTTKKYFVVGLYRSNVTSVTKYKLREVKIELGTKATDWSPAPEDIQGQIDSTTTRISAAESSINQLSNSISLKVDTSTYNSKMFNLDGSISSLNSRISSAELKITDSAIINTVSSTINNAKNEAINSANANTASQLTNYSTKAEMNLTAENLTMKFNSNGGYNLLRNGNLKNSYSFWSINEYSLTGSNLTRNFSVRNDIWTGYQNAIQVQIHTMTSGEYGFRQAIPTIIGKKYVFTCYLAGHRSNKNILIRGTSAGEMNWLTNKTYGSIHGGETLTNWEKVVVTFTAQRTSSWIELNITSTIGSDGYIWAREMMVTEGDDWKPFSPHPEEIYSGSTMIDANGVTVNNGALTVKNNSGQVVMRGDSNGNLLVQNTITVGGNTDGNIQIANSSGTTIFSANKKGTFVKDGTMKITTGNVAWNGIMGYPEGNTREMDVRAYGTNIREFDYSGSQVHARYAFYAGGEMKLTEDNTGNAGGDIIITKITARSVNSPYVIASANGDGKNFQIGDDCWLGDINEYATVKLHCTDNSGRAYLRFGNGAKIGYGGGSDSLDIFGSVHTSGQITTLSNMSSNRHMGKDDAHNTYIGNGAFRVDTNGGNARLYNSWLGNADNGILIDANGAVTLKSNNVNRHVFNSNGTKVGGTMEIEGTVYGMSPTDSPQTLIEYIEYDVEVNGITTIYLDTIYEKMINKYAVFCSNPDIKIIKKNKDNFIVDGIGLADFNIKGQRRDGQGYFKIMGGFEHGAEEEVSI